MPRPNAHPDALFSLIPENELAREVVTHPYNCDFVSELSDGTPILDIGHMSSTSGNSTLATLGRSHADIFVNGSIIARTQCSFDINRETNVIMFFDRSHNETSQVYGENATPFEFGRLRKVVVQPNLNTIIGMGGRNRNLIQFSLRWDFGPIEMMEKVKSWIRNPPGGNPRLALTLDDENTAVTSRRQTTFHIPGQPKMRYTTIGDRLGAGQFGEVFKAVDVDTGRLMAVKILKEQFGSSMQQHNTHSLKREAENLQKLGHPYIVNYIASQMNGSKMEIFMGLKDGSLESLIENHSGPLFATSVMHQMLQALDYLSFNNILHRDVKPANVLYLRQPDDGYIFQLGDFGLCNVIANAISHVGTPVYMAPELGHSWGNSARSVNASNNYSEICETVLSIAANEEAVSRFREMAILNLDDRASAAQMLIKNFNGVGLSTPRHQVPALSDGPTITAARAPASTPAVEQPRHTPLAQPSRRRFGPAPQRRITRAAALAMVEEHRVPESLPVDNNNITDE